MPVCIAIGADPASVYAASAPLPPTVDEFLFAGIPAALAGVADARRDVRPRSARGGRVRDRGLHRSARAAGDRGTVRRPHRILFGGGSVPRRPRDRGHLAARSGVCHDDRRAARRWRTSISDTRPSASSYRCCGSRFPRSWTTTCRSEGIFHNLVFVSIDKQYPGQAYKVMNALWGQGLMSLAKVLVVVDKDVNVRDPHEAWWVALNHIDPERDARFTMGPIDVLDHASRAFTYGSKIGLDGTRKMAGRGLHRGTGRRSSSRTRRRARGSMPCGPVSDSMARRARRQVRVQRAMTREGQTFAGESAVGHVRQLREAAAHRLSAAVRARGGDTRAATRRQ